MGLSAYGNQAIASPPAAGSITVSSPLAAARQGHRSPPAAIAATSYDPWITSRHVPDCASQTCTVWSDDPLTRRRPSGENATLKTTPLCPRKQSSSAPDWCVPDPYRLAVRPADDSAAVGGERHARDPVGLPAEAGKLGAGLCVPDPHRPVGRSADEAPAVRGERHAQDHKGVPEEAGELGAGVASPRPAASRPRPAGDAAAVGGERHARDLAGVPAEAGELGAGLVRPRPAPSGPTTRCRGGGRRGRTPRSRPRRCARGGRRARRRSAASQTRTVWSSDPLTMRRASEENATLETRRCVRGGRRLSAGVCVPDPHRMGWPGPGSIPLNEGQDVSAQPIGLPSALSARAGPG